MCLNLLLYFDDTIKNNILLTNNSDDSSDAKVEEVIKIVELEKFVSSQKNNIDTLQEKMDLKFQVVKDKEQEQLEH